MYRIQWLYKGQRMDFQSVHKESANDVYGALRECRDVEHISADLLTMDVSFSVDGPVYTYLTDVTAGDDDRVKVPTPYGIDMAFVHRCVWRKKSELKLPFEKYKKVIRVLSDMDFPF